MGQQRRKVKRFTFYNVTLINKDITDDINKNPLS